MVVFLRNLREILNYIDRRYKTDIILTMHWLLRRQDSDAERHKLVVKAFIYGPSISNRVVLLNGVGVFV